MLTQERGLRADEQGTFGGSAHALPRPYRTAMEPENRDDVRKDLAEYVAARTSGEHGRADRQRRLMMATLDAEQLVQAAIVLSAWHDDDRYVQYAADLLIGGGASSVVGLRLATGIAGDARYFVEAAAKLRGVGEELRASILVDFASKQDEETAEAVLEFASELSDEPYGLVLRALAARPRGPVRLNAAQALANLG